MLARQIEAAVHDAHALDSHNSTDSSNDVCALGFSQNQNKHTSRDIAKQSRTTHISKRVRVNCLCVIVVASMQGHKLMIRIAKLRVCTVVMQQTGAFFLSVSIYSEPAQYK